MPQGYSHQELGISHGAGNEDFHGLRDYRPGESSRHIAWKAVAREQGLLVKQFEGGNDSVLWLSWDSLNGMAVEERLSQLCRWVLDAHRCGKHYGLAIPGKKLSPAFTLQHQRQCLEALALFGLSGTDVP